VGIWTKEYNTTPEIEKKLNDWIEENYGIGPEDRGKNPKYYLGLEDCMSFASAVEAKLRDLLKEAGLSTSSKSYWSPAPSPDK
jgi:hypothetical protein